MGVVKSGSKVSRNNSPSHTQSSSSTDDELQQKENHMYPDDSGAESDTTDESDVPEVGSELCMVGDDTCSVPYDLFDLKDLKQVLSLETWNSELTDEDRYNLSAYLPDLDQQSYNLTMKQLLEGETLDFNSPMAELFERLKGGLCAPKVSRYREGLQFLQKKEHYHNLRKYHNNMVNTFSEMRKVWKTCPPGAGVEERIGIWNTWRSQKKLPHGEPTAIITVPKQGEASRKSKVGRPPTQSNKKAKTTKSQVVPDVVYPPYQGNIPTMTKADGKGVLKVKAPAKSPIQSESNILKPEYKETVRMPRGVLKLTPKNHGRQEQSQMKLDSAPFMDMQNYEAQARPSLHSQAMGAWEEDSYIGETSIGQAKVKDRKKRTTVEPPDGASLQLPYEYFTNTGPGRSVSAYDKKMKKVKEQEPFNAGMQIPSWYGQDARKFEEDVNPASGNRFTNDFSDSRRYGREGPMFSEHTYADQHWRHLDKQNREYPRSSMEHYADVRDWKAQNFHQSFSNERQMNYSNREPDLEGPGNIHGEQNPFLKSMDRSKKKRKEPRQSLEDSLRLSNEQRNFAEGYGDRHDYLKEQSNFVGNRRQLLDAGGYFEDAKWPDQGKFITEPRRRKQSQIGDFALDLERNVEEPMAFEGSQSSKKSKRKKEHEKVEAMDFFPPQPANRHEYDVKGADGFDKKKPSMKIKIKAGARSSDVLTDTNGAQDRTQSS